MKIPNPFRYHPNTKVSNGKWVSVQPAGEWLEIPDEMLEARIDAIDSGRSDGEVMATRVWSRELGGVMEAADLAMKKQIVAEKKHLEAQKVKREKEAKEAQKVKKVKD